VHPRVFWSWQIQIHGDPYPFALLKLDIDHRLKILFLCKENSGTRSFADLLTRQWRCLGDSGGWLATKKGTNPIVPLRNLFFSVQRLHGFRQVVTHVQPQQKR